MLTNPQRAQANLDEALAQIHTKTRMRLGIVAGVLIVGLFQVDYSAPPGALALAGTPPFLVALLPLAAIAIIGLALIFALRARDIRRAHEAFDKQSFKVPTRKSPKH